MSISLVQTSNNSTGTGTATSLTGTLPTGVKQGNLLVCTLSTGNNTQTFTGPAGWTSAVLNMPGGSNETVSSAIWYLVVDASHAGETSWTWTISATHSIALTLYEWSATNGWITSVVDKTAQGDTSSSPTQGTIISSGTTTTTSQAEELWVANLVYKSGSQTTTNQTSGWTLDATPNCPTRIGTGSLHQIVNATGTAHVQFTIGTAEYWAGCVTTFKTNTVAGVAVAGEADGKSTAVAALASLSASFGGQASGASTANAIVTITKLASSSPNISPVVTRYSARVRSPSLQTVNQIVNFERLAYVRRYNNTGDWAIEVDANDATAALLTQPGYGLTITRTVYDVLTGKAISSRVEMSGPMTGISREMSNNLIQIHGKDDNVWLQRRLAYPSAPGDYISADTLTLAPVRYYRGNTSGTAVTDSSTSAQNGTLNGGYTTGLATMVDSASGAAFSVNGSTGYVSIPTTSLPTGNPSLSWNVWFKLSVFPAVSGTVAAYGTATAHEILHITVNSTGGVYVGQYGVDTDPSDIKIGVGEIHMLTATWDGTTMVCYVDGVRQKDLQPGPMVMPATGNACTLGQLGNGTSWIGGTIGEATLFTSALSDTDVQELYAWGISHLAHQAYDTQTGICETVLKHYVAYNLGSSAETARQLSNFAIATDQTRGSSVTGNARFDPLVQADGTGLLQQLALSGGLGFELSALNGQLSFDVYVPTDRTMVVYFSQRLGNLLDFVYTYDAPASQETGGNAFVVGGGGQGQGRVFQEVDDNTSVSSWGRAEQFVDARDTTTLSTLQQRGQAALSASAEVTTFRATMTSSPQTRYGVDFDLGDKVTTVIDGVTFQEQIIEVDVTLESGKAESIVPIVGTPNATVVKDAVLNHMRKLQKSVSMLRSLQNRL